MTGRRTQKPHFVVTILLLGLAAMLISAALVVEAYTVDRPDVAALRHRYWTMAGPILLVGAGLAGYGILRLCCLRRHGGSRHAIETKVSEEDGTREDQPKSD